MEKRVTMENIYGYQLVTELTNKNSGFGRWGFAVKDGKDYFIKEFLAPVYPESSLPISDAERKRRVAECGEFFDSKMKLYQAIKEANNGNIIQIEAFFRYKTHFYIVTDKVNTASLDVAQIAALPEEKKHLLLKVLTHSMKNLGHYGIVHGDLKPDNILVKETHGGFYTIKLIDFDSSFFETDTITENDDIQGDTVYLAPETFLCMLGECQKISVKADVFALGILFHQYLCGDIPKFSTEYDYMYEAVLDGADYQLDSRIPVKYRQLIQLMLEADPEKRISIDNVMDILMGQNPEAYLKSEDEEKEMPSFIDDAACDSVMESGSDNPGDAEWMENPSENWGTEKVKVEENPKEAAVNLNIKEPGITADTLYTKKAVVINGLKMSGNLHKEI